MPSSLRVFVIVLVVFLAPLSAAATPFWSSEQPVGDAGSGVASAIDASVAFNGEIYVVVWRRFDEIVGTRLRADGSPIDPFPFRVSEQPHANARAEVVWNGADFLIVWRSSYYDTSARFLRPDGSLSPIHAISSGEFSMRLYAASNGHDTLIINDTTDPQPRIVDRGGSVRELPRLGPKIWISSVASFGGGWAIAARDNSAGHSERTVVFHVASDGTLTKAADLPARGSANIFATASGYLLFSSAPPLTAMPLDAAARVAGEPFIVYELVPQYARVTATLLGNGSMLVVAQIPSESGGIGVTIAIRITGRDVATPVVLGELEAPLLVPGAPMPLLVWGWGSLRHGHIDPSSLRLVSEFVTARAAVQQTSGAAVGVVDGWFTVWRSGNAQIRGAVVRPRVSIPVEFEVSGVEPSVGRPAVAANSDIVLVVWASGQPGAWSSLYGRRFAHSGAAIDPTPFVIHAVSGGAVTVAWNGRYFVVVATKGYEGLRLSRVTVEGIVLDPDGKAVAVSARNASQSLPSLAIGGDATLLVWQDGELWGPCQITCPPPPPPARIEGVRLTSEGDPIDSQPIVFSDEGALAPAVAVSGGRFLVAWNAIDRIEGKLFEISAPWDASPFAIATEPSRDAVRVAVSPSPSGFFVAWNAARAVLGAFVDHAGVARAATEFFADSDHGYALPEPFVAARGDELLLGYSRWKHEVGGVYRLFVRHYAAPALRGRPARR